MVVELDHRIGFVDWEELDDEVPAIVSIVTSWGRSQRLSYQELVAAILLTFNPLLGLLEVVTRENGAVSRQHESMSSLSPANKLRVLHHLRIFAHQKDVFCIVQLQRPQQQPFSLRKNLRIDDHHSRQ